ncbi:hypothetical protein BDZ97DRAFT_1923432 [Flammula alnicola]|nr:hypothetical protein BDZ97DRAFT_1923432 [Flammula alnicola]
MATLNAAVTLPNPLVPQNSPTRNAHIAQIDPGVIYLLRTTIESNIHYESQLHGPVGAFLESIFPQRRRFMNIAQAILREVVDPEDRDDDLSNISFGSTGGEHRSRNTPGQEKNKLLPDFLTVKVVLRPPRQPRDYRIVTVVELKRNDEDQTNAETQMVAYMVRVNEIAAPNNSFRGFLVMEDHVQVYGYTGYGPNRSVEMVDEYDMFAPGNPFTRDLADIATNYWN